MFNWNDLESFLTLSRTGKLNLAAKKLKIESTTISRRILRLEQKLGTKLFFRSNNSYVCNDSGQKLIIYAERVESEIFSINQSFFNKSPNISGAVRIAVPEGLGVEIFTRYLKEFYELYPEIELELLADTKARSLLKREIDILITLSRPTKGKLIAWKLADYELRLYGSHDYLQNNQPILTIKDLDKHKFISYVDDLIDFPELKYLEDISKNMKIIFRSNSLRAQLNAVKQGAGISLLHTFIAKKESSLRIVLQNEIKVIRQYWVTVHEDLLKINRIRNVVDFFSNAVKKEIKNFRL